MPSMLSSLGLNFGDRTMDTGSVFLAATGAISLTPNGEFSLDANSTQESNFLDVRLPIYTSKNGSDSGSGFPQLLNPVTPPILRITSPLWEVGQGFAIQPVNPEIRYLIAAARAVSSCVWSGAKFDVLSTLIGWNNHRTSCCLSR